MQVRFIIPLLTLVIISAACAQEERSIIPALKASSPPEIDGALCDPCWEQAPSVCEFYFTTNGSAALEPTTTWICYDDTHVYIAFDCKDSQPSGIVAQQKKRGGSLRSDDWVGVNLACYQDQRPIVWFNVSADGVQTESLQSGDVSKIEWRGDWRAAAKRTEDGYTVEMAIPFCILQYDPNATAMSIAFQRKHTRTNYTWWSPHVGSTGTEEPRRYYLWQGLQLPRPKSRPLIMGYVLAGAGDGYSSCRTGLDVKYALTPTMTGALTVNPDFRNVEQDVNDVDFTYTEQFRPDSRPFFQEGNGYFPGSDVFYTREIKEIDAGAKIYGKYGNYSLGALNVRRHGKSDYSVLSLGRDWPDKARLYLRGVQSSEDGRDNFVSNVAGIYYLRNDGDRKTILDAELITSALTLGGVSKSYDLGIRSYGRPRTLEWSIRYEYIDPDFDPLLGYTPETDLRSWRVYTEFGDRLTSGKMNHWNTSLSATFADHTDASHYYDTFNWSNHLHWQNETAINLDVTSSRRRQYLKEQNGVPAHYESFHDRYARFRLRLHNADLYKATTATIALGTRAGGPYLYYGLESGRLITERLSIRASYGFSRIKEPSPLAYSSTQLITTLTYDISDERTLGGRLVSGKGSTNVYLAYKQRVRSGMDIYVIYGDPNAESTTNSVLLKVIRPV